MMTRTRISSSCTRPQRRSRPLSTRLSQLSTTCCLVLVAPLLLRCGGFASGVGEKGLLPFTPAPWTWSPIARPLQSTASYSYAIQEVQDVEVKKGRPPLKNPRKLAAALRAGTYEDPQRRKILDLNYTAYNEGRSSGPPVKTKESHDRSSYIHRVIEALRPLRQGYRQYDFDDEKLAVTENAEVAQKWNVHLEALEHIADEADDSTTNRGDEGSSNIGLLASHHRWDPCLGFGAQLSRQLFYDLATFFPPTTRFLELGILHGSTTAFLAATFASVRAVDLQKWAFDHARLSIQTLAQKLGSTVTSASVLQSRVTFTQLDLYSESWEAAFTGTTAGDEFDVAIIDAAHTYREVLSDLTNLLRIFPGVKYLVLDDMDHADVRLALKDFMDEYKPGTLDCRWPVGASPDDHCVVRESFLLQRELYRRLRIPEHIDPDASQRFGYEAVICRVLGGAVVDLELEGDHDDESVDINKRKRSINSTRTLKQRRRGTPHAATFEAAFDAALALHDRSLILYSSGGSYVQEEASSAKRGTEHLVLSQETGSRGTTLAIAGEDEQSFFEEVDEVKTPTTKSPKDVHKERTSQAKPLVNVQFTRHAAAVALEGPSLLKFSLKKVLGTSDYNKNNGNVEVYTTDPPFQSRMREDSGGESRDSQSSRLTLDQLGLLPLKESLKLLRQGRDHVVFDEDEEIGMGGELKEYIPVTTASKLQSRRSERILRVFYPHLLEAHLQLPEMGTKTSPLWFLRQRLTGGSATSGGGVITVQFALEEVGMTPEGGHIFLRFRPAETSNLFEQRDFELRVHPAPGFHAAEVYVIEGNEDNYAWTFEGVKSHNLRAFLRREMTGL
ncbi:unnamed protein product [Amoebophrya sp. A25]|nr:unnamed protein product [Amoebophrya sp. A25]|eukprot:GSA25T00007474001.1